MLWKHHLRKKKNLQALLKCVQNKYDEALAIVSAMQPYYMIDKSDIFALKMLSFISAKCNKKLESKIYRNSFRCFLNRDGRTHVENDEKKTSDYYDRFIHLQNKELPEELLNKIIEDCLSFLRTTEAAVFLCLLKKSNGKLNKDTEIIIAEKYDHVFSFTDDLLSGRISDCIVIEDLTDDTVHFRCIALCRALKILGLNVTLILSGNRELIDYNSFGIQAVKFADNFENRVFNYIINSSNNFSVSYLFGDHTFLEQLNEHPGFYRVTQMFHRNPTEFPYRRMDCLLVGDYYNTKSVLYKQDIRQLVFEEPTVDFSIIIPARNSAYFLKYSIETCLKQNYSGTYEILISDNSISGNDEVYRLIQQMNHPLIRYIRTPYNLSLAQSFEYAYLNARGEKIISIGSDDGLVDCALTTLDSVFQQIPQNDIVHFDGTFYQWPTDSDDGYLSLNQEAFRKKEITSVDCTNLLTHVLKDYVVFTEMPILYMHTCIRKKHIQKIIDRTGKFEFGDSQDVYTGLLNLILEKEVTYVSYPLLIGGNSGIGVGQGVRNRIRRGELPSRSSYFRYYDYYSKRFAKYNNIDIISDKEHFFIMREYEKIMGMNIFNEEILTDEDYLDVFENIYALYPLNSVDINILVKQLEKIAQNRGTEFYQKFLKCRLVWERRRSEREKKEARDKRIVFARSKVQKSHIGRLAYSLYRKMRRRQVVAVNTVAKKHEDNNPITIVTQYNGQKIDNVFLASKYLSGLFDK